MTAGERPRLRIPAMASSDDLLDSLPDYSALTLDERSAAEPLHGSMHQPVASTSSLSPHASTSSSTGSQRTNPLTDLITTERLYVDDLANIIKRVAAAWSRNNFPPAHLDAMFRAIEAVYRINKALLSKLMEIGPSPSSPKLLGDLLMRWIDELEPAYSKYASALTASFDDDPSVQCNQKLAGVLESLPPVGSSRLDAEATTLDTLFVLPFYRLRYYKKLYAKLLKSTQPGRSDHRLLIGANDKLDTLLAACDNSLQKSFSLPTRQSDGATDKILRPLHSISPPAQMSHTSARSQPDLRALSPSDQSSFRGYGTSPSNRLEMVASSSLQTLASSTFPSSSSASLASLPQYIDLNDLEKRLDAARTLDIFSMKPKKCRLQIQPPTLGFQRQMRHSGRVHMSFVPASDPMGREVSIEHAHLFVLTDLFLLCEPIAAGERMEATPGADFWLLFPPLAGKHLRAERVDADPNAFDVVVMRKERLRLRCDSRMMIGEWIEAFEACTAFGSSALRVKTEARDLRSPVLSASPQALSPGAGGRTPISPAESNFSAQSELRDRPPPPRILSTVSDPVGSRSRSADPDYAPPPPFKSSNGVTLSRSERRSSLGPGSLPQSVSFPVGASQGLPPGAGGGPGRRSPRGFANPSPTTGGPPDHRNRFNSSISRQTDPGFMANGHLHAPSNSSSSHGMQRSRSADGLRSPANGLNERTHYRAPSAISPIPPLQFDDEEDDEDFGAEATAVNGPVKSQVAAQMRCKVFLQQHKTQWKSMGTARLRLYVQMPIQTKQLVVEQGDGKSAKPVISTIVMTDGVERVGKTGIAIELSDNGSRTGIIYMIQLKSEQIATSLFQQLLIGSNRTNGR